MAPDSNLIVAGALMVVWGIIVLAATPKQPHPVRITLIIVGTVFVAVPMARVLHYFLTH